MPNSPSFISYSDFENSDSYQSAFKDFTNGGLAGPLHTGIDNHEDQITSEILRRVKDGELTKEEAAQARYESKRASNTLRNNAFGKDSYATDNAGITVELNTDPNLSGKNLGMLMYMKQMSADGLDAQVASSTNQISDAVDLAGGDDKLKQSFIDNALERKVREDFKPFDDLSDKELLGLTNTYNSLSGDQPFETADDVRATTADMSSGDTYGVIRKVYDATKRRMVDERFGSEERGSKGNMDAAVLDQKWDKVNGRLIPARMRSTEDHKNFIDDAATINEIYNLDSFQVSDDLKLNTIMNLDSVRSSVQDAYINSNRTAEREAITFDGDNDYDDFVEVRREAAFKEGRQYTKSDQYLDTVSRQEDMWDGAIDKTFNYIDKVVVEGVGSPIAQFLPKVYASLGSDTARSGAKFIKERDAARNNLMAENGFNPTHQVMANLVGNMAPSIIFGTATGGVGAALGISGGGMTALVLGSSGLTEGLSTYANTKLDLHDTLLETGMDADEAWGRAHKASLVPAIASASLTMLLGKLGGADAAVIKSLSSKTPMHWSIGDIRRAFKDGKAFKAALKETGDNPMSQRMIKSLIARHEQAGITFGQMTKHRLRQEGLDFAGEFVEEGTVGGVQEWLVSKAFSDNNVGEEATIGEILKSAVIEGALGGVVGTGVGNAVGFSQATKGKGGPKGHTNLFYETRTADDARSLAEFDAVSIEDKRLRAINDNTVNAAKAQNNDGGLSDNVKLAAQFSTAENDFGPLQDPRQRQGRFIHEDKESPAIVAELQELGLSATEEAFKGAKAAPGVVADTRETTGEQESPKASEGSPVHPPESPDSDVAQLFDKVAGEAPLNLAPEKATTTPEAESTEKKGTPEKAKAAKKVMPNHGVRVVADTQETGEHPVFGTGTWAQSSLGGFPSYSTVNTLGDKKVEQISFTDGRGNQAPTAYVQVTDEKGFKTKRKATKAESKSKTFLKPTYTEKSAQNVQAIFNGAKLDNHQAQKMYRSKAIHPIDAQRLADAGPEGAKGIRIVQDLNSKSLPNPATGDLKTGKFDPNVTKTHARVADAHTDVDALILEDGEKAILHTAINKVEARIQDVYEDGGNNYYFDEDAQALGQANIESFQTPEPVVDETKRQFTLKPKKKAAKKTSKKAPLSEDPAPQPSRKSSTGSDTDVAFDDVDTHNSDFLRKVSGMSSSQLDRELKRKQKLLASVPQSGEFAQKLNEEIDAIKNAQSKPTLNAPDGKPTPDLLKARIAKVGKIRSARKRVSDLTKVLDDKPTNLRENERETLTKERSERHMELDALLMSMKREATKRPLPPVKETFKNPEDAEAARIRQEEARLLAVDGNTELDSSEDVTLTTPKPDLNQSDPGSVNKVKVSDGKTYRVGSKAPDGTSIVLEANGGELTVLSVDLDGKNEKAARAQVDKTLKKATNSGLVLLTPDQAVTAINNAVQAQYPGIDIPVVAKNGPRNRNRIGYVPGTGITVGEGFFTHAMGLFDGDATLAGEYVTRAITEEVRHHITLQQMPITDLLSLGESLYKDGRIEDLRAVYPEAVVDKGVKPTPDDLMRGAAEYLNMMGQRITQGAATADLVSAKQLPIMKRWLAALKRAYRALSSVSRNADVRVPLARIEAKLASLAAAPTVSQHIENSVRPRSKTTKNPKSLQRLTLTEQDKKDGFQAKQTLLGAQDVVNRGGRLGDNKRQGEGMIAIGKDGKFVLRYEADVWPTVENDHLFQVGDEQIYNHAQAQQAVDTLNRILKPETHGADVVAAKAMINGINETLGLNLTHDDALRMSQSKNNDSRLNRFLAKYKKAVKSIEALPKTVRSLVNAIGGKWEGVVISDSKTDEITKGIKNKIGLNKPKYSKLDPITFHLLNTTTLPSKSISLYLDGKQVPGFTPDDKFFQELRYIMDRRGEDTSHLKRHSPIYHGGSVLYLERFLGGDQKLRIPPAEVTWSKEWAELKPEKRKSEADKLNFRKSYTMGQAAAAPYMNSFLKGGVTRDSLSYNLGVHHADKGTSLGKIFSRLEAATVAAHAGGDTPRGTSEFFAQPSPLLFTDAWMSAFTDYLAAVKQMSQGNSDSDILSPIEVFADQMLDTAQSLRKNGWPSQPSKDLFFKIRSINDVSSSFSKNIKSSLQNIVSNDSDSTPMGLVFQPTTLAHLEGKYSWGVREPGSVGVIRVSSARSVARELSDGLYTYNSDNFSIDMMRSISGQDTRDGLASEEVDSALISAMQERNPEEGAAIKRAIDRRTALGFYLHNGDADATRLFFAQHANTPATATSELVDMLHERIKFEDKEIELNANLVKMFGDSTGSSVYGSKLISGLRESEEANSLPAGGEYSLPANETPNALFRDKDKGFTPEYVPKPIPYLDPEAKRLDSALRDMGTLGTELSNNLYRSWQTLHKPTENAGAYYWGDTQVKRKNNIQFQKDLKAAIQETKDADDGTGDFSNKRMAAEFGVADRGVPNRDTGELGAPKPEQVLIQGNRRAPSVNDSLFSNPAHLERLDELGFDVDSLSPKRNSTTAQSNLDDFLTFIQENSNGSSPAVTWSTLKGMDPGFLPDSASRDGFVTDGSFEAVHATLLESNSDLPVAYIDGEFIPREMFGWNTSGIIMDSNGNPTMMFIDTSNEGNGGLSNGPEMAIRDLATLAMERGLSQDEHLNAAILDAMIDVERAVNGSLISTAQKKTIERLAAKSEDVAVTGTDSTAKTVDGGFSIDKPTLTRGGVSVETEGGSNEGTFLESAIAGQLSRYLEKGSDGSNALSLQSIRPAKFLLDAMFDPNLASVLATVNPEAFASLGLTLSDPSIVDNAEELANNIFVSMAVSSRVDTTGDVAAPSSAVENLIDPREETVDTGEAPSPFDTNEGFNGALPQSYQNLTTLYTSTLTALSKLETPPHQPIHTLVNFSRSGAIVDNRSEAQVLADTIAKKDMIVVPMTTLIRDPKDDSLRGREGGRRNLWRPLTNRGGTTGDYTGAARILARDNLITAQDNQVQVDTKAAWMRDGSAYDKGVASYTAAETALIKAYRDYAKLSDKIRGVATANSLFNTTANPTSDQLSDMISVIKDIPSILGDVTHQAATVNGAARVSAAFKPIVATSDKISSMLTHNVESLFDTLADPTVLVLDEPQLEAFVKLTKLLDTEVDSLTDLRGVSTELDSQIDDLVNYSNNVQLAVNYVTGEVDLASLETADVTRFIPTDSQIATNIASSLPQNSKVPPMSYEDMLEMSRLDDFYINGDDLIKAARLSNDMRAYKDALVSNEKYVIAGKEVYADVRAEEALVDNWMQRSRAEKASYNALKGSVSEGSKRMIFEQGRSPDTQFNRSSQKDGFTETWMKGLVEPSLNPAFLPESGLSEAQMQNVAYPILMAPTSSPVGQPIPPTPSSGGRTGVGYSVGDIKNFGLNVRGALPAAQIKVRDHLFNTNLIYKDMSESPAGSSASDIKADIDAKIAMMVAVANDPSFDPSARKVALGALKSIMTTSDLAALDANFNAVLSQATFTDFAKFAIAGKSKRNHTAINKSRFLEQDSRLDKVFSKSIESQSFFHNAFNYLDSGFSGLAGRNGASAFMNRTDKRISKSLKKVKTLDKQAAAYAAAIATNYNPLGVGIEELTRNVGLIKDGLAGQVLTQAGGVKDVAIRNDVNAQIAGVTPLVDALDAFLASKQGSTQSPAEIIGDLEAFLAKDVLSKEQVELISELRAIFREERPTMEYLAALRGETIGRFENYVPVKGHSPESFEENMYDSHLNMTSNPNKEFMRTRFQGENRALDFHPARVPMSTLKGGSYAAYTKGAYSYFSDAYGSEADNAPGTPVQVNPKKQHYKKLLQLHGASMGPKAALVESSRQYMADAARTQFVNDYGQAKVDSFLTDTVNGMLSMGYRMALTSINQFAAQTSGIAGYLVNHPIKGAAMLARSSRLSVGYMSSKIAKYGKASAGYIAGRGFSVEPEDGYYDNLMTRVERYLPELAERGFDGNNDINNLTRATRYLENPGFIGGTKEKLKKGIHIINKGGEGLSKITVGSSDALFLISILDTEYKSRTGKSLAATEIGKVDRVALNEARMSAETVLAQSATSKKGEWFQKSGSVGVDVLRRIGVSYANDPVSAASKASAGLSMIAEGDAATKVAGARKVVNHAVRSLAYNLSKPAPLIYLIAKALSDDEEEQKRIARTLAERMSYDTPLFKQQVNPMPQEHAPYRIWGAAAADSIGAFLPGSIGAVTAISSVNGLVGKVIDKGIEQVTKTEAPHYDFTHGDYYDALNLLGPVATPLSNVSKYGEALFLGERDYYVGPEDLATIMTAFVGDRDTLKVRLRALQERSKFQAFADDYKSKDASSVPVGFSWNSLEMLPEFSPHLIDFTESDSGLLQPSQPLGANGLYSRLGKASGGWKVIDSPDVYIDKSDDGDSFMINNNGELMKVRLYGADSPESSITKYNAGRFLEQTNRGRARGDQGSLFDTLQISNEGKDLTRSLALSGDMKLYSINESVISDRIQSDGKKGSSDRGTSKDRRLVHAVVNIDGQDVMLSEYMIANGLAKTSTKFNTTKVISPFTGEDLKPRLEALQLEAQRQGLGLWAR